MSFEKLNLIEPILRALTNEGYTKPTPIQEQAIPTLLERKDLLGVPKRALEKPLRLPFQFYKYYIRMNFL